MAREARDEDAAGRVLDDVAQGRSDRRLGSREPGDRGIGGIREQQVDALGAEAVDGVVVRRDTVDRRLVELEVTRMEHGARRGLEEDAERCGNRMGHREERDVECAELHVLTVVDLDERDVLDVVLGELALDEADGELRRVDGNRDVEVHEQVRKRTGVVFVTVGDDDAAQLMLVLEDICVVGKDEVDAGLLIVREHEARIEQDHVVAILEHGHVLADAVETAKRDDLQRGLLLSHTLGGSFQCSVSSA